MLSDPSRRFIHPHVTRVFSGFGLFCAAISVAFGCAVDPAGPLFDTPRSDGGPSGGSPGDASATDGPVARTDAGERDGGAEDDAGVLDAGALPPPGPDTTEPFPIDRGDDGPGTPGSYKGLPLRLVDNGEPTVTPVDGMIGVVCVGMSNSYQECQHFIEQATGQWGAEISSAVVFINCAVGGHAIERWNDPAYDDVLWDACVEDKMPAAGLRPDQARVIYHKAANQFTTAGRGMPLPLYPDAESDFRNFYENLAAFSARMTEKMPSVQAVYSTSRSYGGFAQSAGRGEPLSYEEGHALNVWLADHPSVGGVWYGWGPYIWAPDCASGEVNGSGTCYERSDYQADGVHPAAGARSKISTMIHARFGRHAWYSP